MRLRALRAAGLVHELPFGPDGGGTWLMSADRDADTFDVRRAGAQQHLAFGHGLHFCMGAPLARIEGEIAVGSLLTRFPAMRPAMPLSEVRWRPGLLLRGPQHLPVH